MLTVQGSDGMILSGGTLNGTGTRTRIDWLTESGVLESDTDYLFEMMLSLDTGTWGVTINGGAAVEGTFDTSKIAAFDRYQAAFQQFSDGDYLDIDTLEVESVPEPVSMGMVILGSALFVLGKRFKK
jgi:hypothetical protein